MADIFSGEIPLHEYIAAQNSALAFSASSSVHMNAP